MLPLLLWIALLQSPPALAPEVSAALAHADYLLAHHDAADALGEYQKADSLAHHQCAVCFLRLGLAERELGNLDAAMADMQHAAGLAGNDPAVAASAHAGRGALLMEMSGRAADPRLEQAVAELRAALQLQPASAVPQFNLGIALIRQEHDAEGIAELNRFLALPDPPAALAANARAAIADPLAVREPPAPAFSFAARDGGTVSNASLRGKVAVLDFWASWCGPCRNALPSLQSLARRFAGPGFTLVGISADTDADAWAKFLAGHAMSWPEFLDQKAQIRGAFHVATFPTYIVLDREGTVKYRASGFDGDRAAELQAAVARELKP